MLRTPYTPWRVYLPFGPPDAVLRLMVGEVASVITTGQRVLPTKALELGYVFKYPHLAEALRAVVEHEPPKPPEPVHAACAAHITRPAGSPRAALAQSELHQQADDEACGEDQRQSENGDREGGLRALFDKAGGGLEPSRILGPNLDDHRAVGRGGLRLRRPQRG